MNTETTIIIERRERGCSTWTRFTDVDAIKCRSILRRIVPHDRTTGQDMPTDRLKMQDRAGHP